MTFQKRKKSHDFPRLFAQFPMIPMTLQTPRFENGYLIIDSYLREGDRHVSFLSFKFLMLMILMIFNTHIWYVHILTTPFATIKWINSAKANPYWIKRIFELTIQKLWLSRHYSIFLISSKKGKIRSDHHCVKGPVTWLSLCSRPSDTPITVLKA